MSKLGQRWRLDHSSAVTPFVVSNGFYRIINYSLKLLSSSGMTIVGSARFDGDWGVDDGDLDGWGLELIFGTVGGKIGAGNLLV